MCVRSYIWIYFIEKYVLFKLIVRCKILDLICFNFIIYIEILMIICIIKRRNNSEWMCLIYINNYIFWLILVVVIFEIYS